MGDKTNDRSFLLPLLGIAGVMLIVCAVVWFVWLRSGGADVRGQVTLDGNPVAGAVVTFITDGGKNPAPIIAVSEKDGAYRLAGNVDGSVPPGSYKVAVVQEALGDGKVPQGETLERARNDGTLVNQLPKIYSDHKTTPFKFDVRSGSNVINLELKK